MLVKYIDYAADKCNLEVDIDCFIDLEISTYYV